MRKRAWISVKICEQDITTFFKVLKSSRIILDNLRVLRKAHVEKFSFYQPNLIQTFKPYAKRLLLCGLS